MSSLTLPLTAAVEKPVAPFTLGYRPALDGVRGIAIALVYVYHLDQIVFGAPEFSTNGFLGVDIFFVLSGFLITSLLLTEFTATGGINLKHFYARRLLRLIPALVVFLVILVAFSLLALSAGSALNISRSALHALFYSTNWITSYRVGLVAKPLGHMWSLAMEEQFYLLWPAFLVLLLKFKVPRPAITGLVASAIILICLHRMALSGSDVWVHRVYSAPDTRADSLMVGCLTAMLVTWRTTSRLGTSLLLSLSALALLFVVSCLAGITPLSVLLASGFTIFAVAVGIFLLWLTREQPPVTTAILERRPLVWLGRISYGLYLWHVPILLASSELGVPAWLRAILATGGVMTIASLSFYLIEGPALRLKSRFGFTRPTLH